MRRRKLGRTGLEVSELGYGAWGIGADMWSGSTDAEALASLRRALEAGVNFFDTAYVYGDGHSEELIAQAFKAAGRRALVATKVPPKNLSWIASRRIEDAFTPEWVVSCTERSLKKLSVERVEVQQLHTWTDDWLGQPALDDVVSALDKLKRDGKIRFWGVSIKARDPKSALGLARSGLPDTMQVVFNLFEQEPQGELFPLCREKGIGVIARVPFDEGGLTGKLREDAAFPEGDFRHSYFAGRYLAETVRRAKELEQRLVGGDTPDLAHAALRFCLSAPEVSTVIPGMRTPAHVDANAAVTRLPPYPAETLKELRAHAWKRDLAPA
ncbi:MAG: aldo/keto reductase [Elusimicrobia bacterium]|nr:aldo/keto reductase [Elusimicrobiota bacterium]